jgi:glycerophosphoryl diester phosphodiesterase
MSNKNIIKLILFIMIISITTIFSLKIYQIILDNEIAKRVLSHRGSSGEEIEHTWASYDLALDYGSRYIEEDIVLSKDGTLYISHDFTAKRIAGLDMPFSEMTDDEINTLITKDDQRLLTVKETFDRYKKKKLTFILEIKDESAIIPLLQLIKDYHYEKRVIVQCFNYEILRVVKDFNPIIKTTFLTATQEDFEFGVNLPFVDTISVEKTFMNQENCDYAHKKGKDFNVYTLNSTEEIKTAIEIGVDNYYTNFTAKAIMLEKKYR